MQSFSLGGDLGDNLSRRPEVLLRTLSQCLFIGVDARWRRETATRGAVLELVEMSRINRNERSCEKICTRKYFLTGRDTFLRPRMCVCVCAWKGNIDSNETCHSS